MDNVMIITCPLCGVELESDVGIAIGQHVVCPCCERKFTYGADEASDAEDPNISAAEATYEEGLNSKFCWKCGAEIPPDSVFCPACGQNLRAEANLANHHKGVESFFQGWGMWAVIAGIVAVVMAIGAGFIKGIQTHVDAPWRDDDEKPTSTLPELTPSEKIMFARAQQQREHPEWLFQPPTDVELELELECSNLPGLGYDEETKKLVDGLSEKVKW